MPFRILLFLAATGWAAAQPGPLSLDDAIRLAWANDPTVAALALTPEVARAREEQAAIRPNPELEVRGSTPTPFRNDSEWALGVGVQQRIPRVERIELSKAYARLGAETAAWRLAEQRRRIAGEVRRLYYEAAVQRLRHDTAGRNLDLQRELRSTLEGRRTAGEIPATEFELLGIEIARAEQALAFSDAETDAILHRLRGRLRLAPEAPLGIDGNFDALLRRPIPAAPADLDAARPSLRLAAHAVREAQAALALSRAASRGDWTVGAGFDFERRTNDFDGRLENDPRLSVSASTPWQKRVTNRGDIMERQAALRIAEAELAALRTDTQAEIVAAVAAVRSVQPVLVAHRGVLSPGAAIPESLRAAHARGEITSLQLVQARQQRFGLESEFLNAAARYATSLAEAETAAGIIPVQP